MIWSWRAPESVAAARRNAALRKQGVVQALMGAALGVAVFFWLSRAVAAVAWGVSGGVLAAALLSPGRVYAGLWKVVNAGARGVGLVITLVLMTPIYYLFFLPFRVLFRTGRRDRLKRAFPDPEARTYWIDRGREGVRPESYRRQF